MKIPIIYGLTVGCLTNQDWQLLNVDVAAVSLDALLIKPGIAQLKKINNLAAWLGWHGKLILLFEETGVVNTTYYQLTSTYDGAKIKITIDELHVIAKQLCCDEWLKLADQPEKVSNAAELLAIAGKFVINGNIFDIINKKFLNDHNILSEHCSCPVCTQGFIRAYLYHLYQQTPLLAHRYLAMHNFILL